MTDEVETPDVVDVHDAVADVAVGDVDEAVAGEAVADEDVLLLAEHDSELVLPVWEPTGEPRVDAALDLITLLDPDDVHAHAAVFTDIHQQLRATLTDLDTAP